MIWLRWTIIQWLQKHLLIEVVVSNDDDDNNNNNNNNNNNGICLMDDLPDDITINILSRLPARCIRNSQTICKKWLALTSSLHFAETHFKSGAYSQISQDKELDPFFLDEEAKRYKMVKIMSNGFVKVVASDISPILVGSCKGLLVFKMFVGTRFLVWDLVTREYAYIDAPAAAQSHDRYFDELWLSAIMFLDDDDPPQGYKLLFSRKINSSGRCKFLIYESFRRRSTKKNTWRELKTCSYQPMWWSFDHAVVNPTIYKRSVIWIATNLDAGFSFYNNLPCTKSVVTFNMDVEEFRYMPLPSEEWYCGRGRAHKHMYFFEEKGRLYFVRNGFSRLEVWSLEEEGEKWEEQWLWLKRYAIQLDYVLREISSIFFPSKTYPLDNVRFIKIEDNVLYFHCSYRGLFMYDWEKKTVKKLDNKRRDFRDYFLGRKHNFTYSDTRLLPESGFRSCHQG